jgi:AcrR family transcriptional regulator
MSKSTRTVTALRLGRRETNKREKLVRIRQAARDVFLRKGYEAATVREIAAAADVAFGTLFLYAKNKQDLLLLLFDKQLVPLAEHAFGKAKADTPFIDQLIVFFAEFYKFFGATPDLSRDMLREITFSSSGIVAARIWATVQETEQQIARLVARAQAQGQVSSSIAPTEAAHLIFSLHRVELRFCLDKAEPDVSGSLNKLRRQFEILFAGLKAHNVSGGGEIPAPHSRKRAVGYIKRI